MIATVIVVVVKGPGVRLYAPRGRGVRAEAAPEDAAGELPNAPPGVRRTAVVRNGRARGIRHLAQYARIRDRDSHPLLFGLLREPHLSAVAATVLCGLRHLPASRTQPVVPPDAVLLLGVQARRHVGRYQLFYLLVRVGPVH